MPEHIPVERIVLEPKNVEGLEKIGEEVSETLEWRSASYVRVEIVRPKYARSSTSVVVADMPSKPVERGLCGPGLMARTVIAKYADHLPLNRQSVIYQREGIDLARSTLCDWIERAYSLTRSLTDVMWSHAITESDYVPWMPRACSCSRRSSAAAATSG